MAFRGLSRYPRWIPQRGLEPVDDRVPEGRYAGTVLARRRIAGIVLAETDYRPGVVVPEHAHDTPLIFGVTGGSMTEERGRRSARCEEGTLVYQPPGEPHAHRFHEGGGRCFIVELGSSWMDRMEALGLLKPAAPLDLRRSRANWVLGQIRDEFRSPDPAAGLAIEGLSLTLLGELQRAGSRTREGARPGWLIRAMELLHASLDREVSMAEIARQVGVHPVHLSRTFPRFHGCTMGEYLRRLRVERARDQLLATDRPLSAIALDAGFADQAHFTRVFRAHTGLTPSAFRVAARR
jgi:AraC family transcriptional regulator